MNGLFTIISHDLQYSAGTEYLYHITVQRQDSWNRSDRSQPAKVSIRPVDPTPGRTGREAGPSHCLCSSSV